MPRAKGSSDSRHVEVAANLPALIPVRDSKRPTGPTLAFSPSAWTTFVGHLR
ncbi:DUF397 domain-containing protein [Streptomyces sp. LBL]|uniref:DUF397 domain-containing protein n=1 Tax=Streptomyces sp. LBL TaxID=2940562 RepID=UPI0024748ADB|nr:DUF397 domain-containing protein [Streptomyces sp. LBL]